MKPAIRIEDLLNIVGASGIRVVVILTSIISVPLLLGLLGQTTYGTWVTLTSVLTWMVFFDFGVGNSLRNTVARYGIDDDQSVYREVFGLFRFLGIVALLLALVLLVAGGCFELIRGNWLTACLLYLGYLVFFPFTLGGSVLQGMGRVGLQSLLQAFGSLIFFGVLLLLYFLASRPGLPVLAGFFSAGFALGSLMMFLVALRLLNIRMADLGGLLRSPIPLARIRVGLGFLLLQLASLVLYNMGNVIIYGNMGPDDVARYDTINRVFQAGFSFFSIFISVMWARISNLLVAQDFSGMRRLHSSMLMISMAFSLVVIVVSLVLPGVIGLWTGGRIVVSRVETFASALLIVAQAVAYAGAAFMNALERISLQVAMAVVATALMLPLSLALMAAGLGIASVAFSAALLTAIPMVVCNLYVRKLLREQG